MDLYDYFESTKGLGVLATADGEGRVDTAIYSRPHVMDDGSVAFIMRDRLSHANLQTNPFASYLFVEDGEGYRGQRLYLRKVREEKESELLYELRRRSYPSDDDPKKEAKFLVFFELEAVRPLLGKQQAE